MSFQNVVCYMSGMAYSSVKKVKSADRQRKYFDMYRRVPYSEVHYKVSHIMSTTLVSALCSARFGLPQLQWNCQQCGLQRQLLVVNSKWFRKRMEPQLQFGQSEHEQQQSMQRELRSSRPRLVLAHARAQAQSIKKLFGCSGLPDSQNRKAVKWFEILRISVRVCLSRMLCATCPAWHTAA